MLLALLVASLLSASRLPGITESPHADEKLSRSDIEDPEWQAFRKVLWLGHTGSGPFLLPPLPNDAALMYRVVRPLLPDGPRKISSFRLFFFWIRSPFILFGLWLGGALWWVTRRLYNNAGGYIALALYCSSGVIVSLSSHVNSEIIAAWGLFGIVYTAIGVAHTLYAPPYKWRPRILLLGTAFGITAGAHLSAALVGLALAALFMLYLAPGRRIASLVILAEASIIAFFILWAFYGFGSAVFSVALPVMRFEPVLHRLNGSAAIALPPLFLVLIIGVVAFIAWPRTRYFGNWAPLVVFLLLVHLKFEGQDTFAWALPFAFVFVGGVFSDLLETRRHKLVAAIAVLCIAAQEAITLLALLRYPH
ncbi:MAG TPA: hypothetical protein VGR50_06130 [Terriglobales bacterium]|nr:hypothetical protein [Terriglobales bacterium]